MEYVSLVFRLLLGRVLEDGFADEWFMSAYTGFVDTEPINWTLMLKKEKEIVMRIEQCWSILNSQWKFFRIVPQKIDEENPVITMKDFTRIELQQITKTTFASGSYLVEWLLLCSYTNMTLPTSHGETS